VYPYFDVLKLLLENRRFVVWYCLTTTATLVLIACGIAIGPMATISLLGAALVLVGAMVLRTSAKEYTRIGWLMAHGCVYLMGWFALLYAKQAGTLIVPDSEQSLDVSMAVLMIIMASIVYSKLFSYGWTARLAVLSQLIVLEAKLQVVGTAIRFDNLSAPPYRLSIRQQALVKRRLKWSMLRGWLLLIIVLFVFSGGRSGVTSMAMLVSALCVIAILLMVIIWTTRLMVWVYRSAWHYGGLQVIASEESLMLRM
jgi:hypothetical protein